MVGCLQRICCFLKKQEEETDNRPEIFVMSNIDKESIPDSDSGVHSARKMNKIGSGSVSEEDSGVGSEGNNQSDIADQTDTSSHGDTDSLKPHEVRRSCSRASKENFSDFELPSYENEPDLTAEISQQLKQMTGFSLEGNTSIMNSETAQNDQSEKKKKRKRRKHRKSPNQTNQAETSEDGVTEDIKEV